MPTAIVVLGTDGANVSDPLAPFEVLAATGLFNVYAASPQRRLVPLTGGLDIVADFSFAQLDERLAAFGDNVEVVVVPAMPDRGDELVKQWLREQAGLGALILSVCYGARVLAEAGVLDDRDATSHWSRISSLEARFPAVRWHRGCFSGLSHDGLFWLAHRRRH